MMVGGDGGSVTEKYGCSMGFQKSFRSGVGRGDSSGSCWPRVTTLSPLVESIGEEDDDDEDEDDEGDVGGGVEPVGDGAGALVIILMGEVLQVG